MAVTGDITSNNDRPAGLSARLRLAWLRLQAVRPGSAGMAARATLRLRKDLGMHAQDIHVSAAGGYVELRGHVAARETSSRAAEIAEKTLGARGVLNFLVVR